MTSSHNSASLGVFYSHERLALYLHKRNETNTKLSRQSVQTDSLTILLHNHLIDHMERKQQSEDGKTDHWTPQHRSECLSSSHGSCQSQIYPSNFSLFFLKRAKLTRRQLSAPLLQSAGVIKGDKTAAVLLAAVLSSFLLSSPLSFPLICPLSCFPPFFPLLSSRPIRSPFLTSLLPCLRSSSMRFMAAAHKRPITLTRTATRYARPPCLKPRSILPMMLGSECEKIKPMRLEI